MRSRAVRMTLLLLAVGALGTAAYFTWSIERRNSASAEISKDVEWKLDATVRQTVELRAAQQAYVAAGQSEQYWMTRVTELTAQVQDALVEIRRAQLSGDTQAALERAADSLTQFVRFDRRARDYAASGQKLLASDVIFSDGIERTQQILTALDEARTAHAADARAAAAKGRRELAEVIGGGAAVALLALLLLTSRGRDATPVIVEESAPVPQPKAAAAPRAKRTAPIDLDLKPPRPAVAAAPARPAPPPPPAAPSTELRDVAEVCTQLARAADISSLPTILQRTALALDAAGVVLWITNPDGAELLAVASHGYAPAVLSRMGPIERDAENVTAAAFRTGLVQTVKGDTVSNGAIAAPLVNASGCVGVLSAEVRHDREREPARLALASIVAAQLATLTAPAARTENRAAL